eukprot:GFUD01008742.1.p1 GENE.GFUD01008742.1~~GFUD01008742.1.p1  ORF type:complete len:476 (-),score=79.04 GFUD01008742.1:336-1691(-)
MNSWRVLTSVRLVRLASAPVCQTTAPGTLLVTRNGSTKASFAKNNDKQNNKNGQNNNNGQKAAIALASAAALALKVYYDQEGISLQAQTEDEDFAHENRVRMYMAPDKIFNYFASFQLISGSGQETSSVGADRKTMMMTPMDFYSAITPDCTLAHGVGAGAHVDVTEAEVAENKFYMEKSPIQGSILNEIGAAGLLSYSDFCFLLTMLSTPQRYIDTAFNLFDVTGDGNIEAKEFAYVSTKMAHKTGGFGSYTNLDQEDILASSSGLLNYLFGKDRKKSINREDIKKLQIDLLEEIIQLEFSEYDKDGSGRISESDLCKFLLKNTKIPPKKQAAMLKRVEKIWPSKARGISLPSFKNLFYVLAGGAELERALFFLDVEGIGVDIEEFRKISSWVSHSELSDHVAKVLFALLDDDGDGRFFKEEIGAVIFDWRQSRGFEKGSLHVSMGQLRI